MKVTTIEMSGFVSCFNTLRKPFKKECRSITEFYIDSSDNEVSFSSMCSIHPNDLKLLQRLIKNGDEHAKAIRLINVTAEIQAPLFWWSEMDTYEVGVVNGCSESTMHTLKNETVTKDHFEYGVLPSYLEYINSLNSVDISIQLIKNDLPSGYLQTRDINFSYQTLRRICKQRVGHKLPQWGIFIDWVKTLPLANELIFI